MKLRYTQDGILGPEEQINPSSPFCRWADMGTRRPAWHHTKRSDGAGVSNRESEQVSSVAPDQWTDRRSPEETAVSRTGHGPRV